MKKIISILIMIIFLWQNVAVCASRQGTALRPPMQGSLAEEVTREANIENILSRIERLMRLKTQKSMVEVDLLEMQLLHTIGLLRRDVRVFNVLSGASLFPGFYVDEMWTSDREFSGETVRNVFSRYWQKIEEDLGIPLVDILPPLEGLGRIHHDSSDALTEEFIQRWASHMRPGDVVFLKMSLEYLLHYGASPDQVRAWVNRFAERIPPGVTLVIFETDLLRGTAIFKEALYPEKVATHLLRTGLFEDYADKLLTPSHRRRLDQINDKMNYRAVDIYAIRLGEGFPAIAIGGKLSILRKISGPISIAVTDKLSQQPARTCP